MRHGANYVSEEEWTEWERDRAERSCVASFERRRELAMRPSNNPSAEDMRGQIASLRDHNERLLAEQDQMAEWFLILLDAATHQELRMT